MSPIEIIDCPACDGEGRNITMGIVYEPGCGHPHMGEVCEGLCPTCHGSCDEEIEPEHRTLADLDQEDYDMLEAKTP